MRLAPIAVAASPRGGDTSGLAAALAVAAAHHDAGGCLLVEVSSGAPVQRTPTLLASPGARAIERSLRVVDLEGASRGHLCTISFSALQWEEISPEELITAAGSNRVVVSLGSHAPHEQLSRWELDLAGCVVLLDLPEERSLGALTAAELVASGIPVKLTGSKPGPVASRRALAGVLPGGSAERYARRVVGRFAAGSGAKSSRR